jgi:hypothetical protein
MIFYKRLGYLVWIYVDSNLHDADEGIFEFQKGKSLFFEDTLA